MTERPARSGGASRALAAKLAALIIVSAFTAAAMLSMRQQRLQAAHELAQAHVRARSHERTVSRLQAEIGRRIAPNRIGELVEGVLVQPAVEGWRPSEEGEQAPLARIVGLPGIASPHGATP